MSLDPNTHTQESKTFAVDVRPGRCPRHPASVELVRAYPARAGNDAETGTEL